MSTCQGVGLGAVAGDVHSHQTLQRLGGFGSFWLLNLSVWSVVLHIGCAHDPLHTAAAALWVASLIVQLFGAAARGGDPWRRVGSMRWLWPCVCAL